MGGKKYLCIDVAELQMADPSLHFESNEIVGLSCRSILCKKNKNKGVLLRVGEHLLVTSELNGHQVIQASQFFAVCNLNRYYIFVKGQLYIWPANKPVHSYSGNQIVNPLSHTLILQVSKILRKVILYPNPDPNPEVSSTSYVVLDYYRPSLPCSVQDTVVPVYPETNDMVQVHGSNDEIWLGHVITVDNVNKTCTLNFYVEDPSCPGRFKQESFGRLSVNTVHWECITSVCEGNWSSNGRYWFNIQ